MICLRDVAPFVLLVGSFLAKDMGEYMVGYVVRGNLTKNRFAYISVANT